jgi:hypothetical protein
VASSLLADRPRAQLHLSLVTHRVNAQPLVALTVRLRAQGVRHNASAPVIVNASVKTFLVSRLRAAVVLVMTASPTAWLKPIALPLSLSQPQVGAAL